MQVVTIVEPSSLCSPLTLELAIEYTQGCQETEGDHEAKRADANGADLE